MRNDPEAHFPTSQEGRHVSLATLSHVSLPYVNIAAAYLPAKKFQKF